VFDFVFVVVGCFCQCFGVFAGVCFGFWFFFSFVQCLNCFELGALDSGESACVGLVCEVDCFFGFGVG